MITGAARETTAVTAASSPSSSEDCPAGATTGARAGLPLLPNLYSLIVTMSEPFSRCEGSGCSTFSAGLNVVPANSLSSALAVIEANAVLPMMLNSDLGISFSASRKRAPAPKYLSLSTSHS